MFVTHPRFFLILKSVDAFQTFLPINIFYVMMMIPVTHCWDIRVGKVKKKIGNLNFFSHPNVARHDMCICNKKKNFLTENYAIKINNLLRTFFLITLDKFQR